MENEELKIASAPRLSRGSDLLEAKSRPKSTHSNRMSARLRLQQFLRGSLNASNARQSSKSLNRNSVLPQKLQKNTPRSSSSLNPAVGVPSRPRFTGESSFSTDEIAIAKNTEFERNLEAFKSTESLQSVATETDIPTKYALTYFLCMGIAYTTRSTVADSSTMGFDVILGQPLAPADFSMLNKIMFPAKGSHSFNTPEHSFGDFRFTEVAPIVFRRLRFIHRVDETQFRSEILDQNTLIEFNSNSKSKCFFFHTAKGNFFIKSVTSYEVDVLLELLPAYYRHMLGYPNSLLTRYVGLYRIQYPSKKQDKYFVVMKSVYSPSLGPNGLNHKKIHNVFDIKGATIGRQTDEGSHSVKKDLNCVAEITSGQMRKLNFGVFSKEFGQQLNRDTKFLRRYNIMDYSLLVAVHDPQQQVNPRSTLSFDPNRNSFVNHSVDLNKNRVSMAVQLASLNNTTPQSISSSFTSVAATLGSAGAVNVSNRVREMLMPKQSLFSRFESQQKSNPGEKPVEYYLGVIDILQPYNVKKFVENKWKGLKYDRNEISAVPATQYQRRFVSFVINNLVATRQSYAGNRNDTRATQSVP